MDEKIKNRLQNISRVIAEEKGIETLRFFGLLERTDLDQKWDLLISADWIERSSNEKDFLYVIDKLKKEFGNDLEFLSRIVLMTPQKAFIKNLAMSLENIELQELPKEIFDFKVSSDFILKHAFIFHLNFKSLDIKQIDLGDSGIIAKEITEF